MKSDPLESPPPLSPQHQHHSPLKDDLNHPALRQLRSASPAVKRPASDMGAHDREEHNTDADVEMSDPKNDTQSSVDLKAKQLDTGLTHGDRQIPHISHPGAVQQDAPSDSTGTSVVDSVLHDSSRNSTAATSMDHEVGPTVEPPAINEQVGTVLTLVQKEPVAGQKGYLVSQKWLNRVWARSADPPPNVDKSATEGEIGPIDNMDIAMVTEDSGKLLDQAGDKFVSLRPGLRMGEEYQVLPQEAWDLIVSWYGIAKDSPIITRYAYNIAGPDAVENVQYETTPPIFSLLKVPAETTLQTQKDAHEPPARLLSTKYMSSNEWLKQAKAKLNIDMATKVRVWRILGGLKNTHTSGNLTPVASRSASPAPGAEILANAGDRMLLDVNTFAALTLDEHREQIQINDQTNDPKYNGKSTLDTFSLGGRNDVLAFEEQKGGPGGGEWPSEHARISVAKSQRDKVKGLTPSGRTSPAPGMTTRGRSRQNGRPRGITGLSNLGNTCYMNSALQSLRSVEELTEFFLHDTWKRDLNYQNILGHHGDVAKAYASLITEMYDENKNSVWPGNFKKIVGKYGTQFQGYGQQDSQEFLLFLLDGLSEDLNRIVDKPYTQIPDSTDEMVHDPQKLKEFANECWELYKARNDSVVTDLFAGMYKSTVTCPECDKVSIIFDPFSNLTLQLPVENLFAKEIWYVPFGGPCIRVDIEIDKNASIRALKELIAKKMGSQADYLICAENYKNKFYKIYDNPIILSEAQIQANDQICIFELDSIPTNYNPNKVAKQNYGSYLSRAAEDEEVDADSPGADRLLVPLYHRNVKNPHGRTASRPFFGIPTYLVIDRKSNMTYDGVLRKVLMNVNAMTTNGLFDHKDYENAEDSDTVVMTDDGSGSGPNATSESGEDGYVDVSMRDSDEQIADKIKLGKKYLSTGRPLPERVTNMFEITTTTTGEAIPTGWNNISEHTDFPSIKLRVPKTLAHRRAKTDSSGSTGEESGSEEGDVPEIPYADNTPESTADSGMESDQDDVLPSMEEESNEVSMKKSKGRNKRRGKKSYGGKNRTFLGKVTRQHQPPKQPTPAPDTPGLIKPGEAIVLDWDPNVYDAIFGADPEAESEDRGAPTWKSVPLLPDQALKDRRSARIARRKNGVSLEDCLNEFGKTETLSEQNMWYCSRCKEHRRADKKFEVWKCPDILVMHLKRFSSARNFRDKLEVKVDYPLEGLDMSKMVLDPEGKVMIYDLIAVDNHYGGLGGGHYTAFAKHFGNGNWYEYNGKSITFSVCGTANRGRRTYLPTRPLRCCHLSCIPPLLPPPRTCPFRRTHPRKSPHRNRSSRL
jgi:ubiquitin carboxyl-terminal hydrolase 4/11